MLPDNRFGIETTARGVRRRLTAGRNGRAARFAPPEWPVSRGPTPNPRRA
ncbi:hypothetical protein Ade02nite_37740 [Paractinoplanes deccanensis]|uniref:Uncharacterized protein n=1 Tax=Paractinoplanes deccanensis TaxID=113561 RepID=A0ABQ3Y571_9ACTN|nr:hypothetical protein [Actinoplanes deccanensis]GID75133.1 hypothetical protein Ade02nite_37740 [Actinoplanes deccanensis]